MKTKVNLYSAAFHPQLRLMTLHLVLLSGLCVLLLFVGLWLYAQNQQQALSRELALSQQQKNQQTNVISTLQTKLAKLQKDPVLLQRVEQNIETLEQKQRVLSEITRQESLKSNGFARLMNELAEHHPSGLWLSHISLDGHDVQLEGAAVESSLIPKWLNTLGNTAYFKGQEFAETRLYRSEQQLNFVIASSANSTKQSGAKGAGVNE